ncbi:AMP-binding protein [Oceanicella actignis]|uniref:Long-chain acyl-CoA synthetase n=1 Tax=Oceanicella actignis TaxID=1189325 RepID=A0A1M7TKU3_9RHOB|nr:AMP-binding protein [Oceanicella actignis]TYO88262.1 long-chain acyl-CoA synthetase [Oceanicella actignis]SET68688.1 long-chain acyl-CoA synthetase [Oceanicella actignis]SHN71316.1 long-chain acyl-CoA synthetase [Oceanicella actignis]
MTRGAALDSALDTFPKLLEDNARRFGDRPANREKEFGIWQSWTWREVRDGTRALAMGFMALGLEPGEHVAIIGKNRPKLYWSMIASQYCGATPVPVYQDAVAEEMAFVLEHAEVVFAVCEDQEQVDKVLAVKDRLPKLRHVIYLDPRGLRKYDHTTLHSMEHVERLGQDRRAELEPRIDAIRDAGKGSDTCVMLYTSGTTGRSKGVVLSNDNVIVTARGAAQFDDLRETDSVLAYLPMAWVGDFVFSVGQAYVVGFCVSCPESQETMMADLKEIGPTYFFAPPRIFETILTNVAIRMEDAGRVKKWLYDVFMAHAKKVGPDILDGKPVGLGARLKYWLGELLIYGPLKNVLGFSNVRVGYTAGEAIGPEIFQFYRSLGINLKQLYGQTEATVFITIQPDGQVRADTVGVPGPGVEIRIADNGEVFYRSPGVFQEYYKNPESTADTKDAEGWVATGDAGFIDPESGQLRIIDRAKDVGKMADGSMFAPKFVENKLKFYPPILEAVVFGAGRDRCVAFINIDMAAVGNWAERNNIAYASYQELAAHPQVYAWVQKCIEEVNRDVAQDPMLSGCQIHRFLILHKELDADDGEMTRTRKVRRRIVEERYKPLIDALYAGEPSAYIETEVTYEDGRKGKIAATLELRDVAVFERRSEQGRDAA